MALRAGVAQVIVPMGFDQQLWADRVESLGVGAAVNLDELPPAPAPAPAHATGSQAHCLATGDGRGWGAALRRAFDPGAARAVSDWAREHNAPADSARRAGRRGADQATPPEMASASARTSARSQRFSECASGGAQTAARCITALAGGVS